jgi:hypothetical protein
VQVNSARKIVARVMRIITLPFCVRGTFYRVKVKDAHPAMAGWPLQIQMQRQHPGAR